MWVSNLLRGVVKCVVNKCMIVASQRIFEWPCHRPPMVVMMHLQVLCDPLNFPSLSHHFPCGFQTFRKSSKPTKLQDLRPLSSI